MEQSWKANQTGGCQMQMGYCQLHHMIPQDILGITIMDCCLNTQSWVEKGHWRQGVLPISIVGCLLSMVSSQMKISGIFSLSSGQHVLNVNNAFRKALTQRTDAAAVRQNLLVRSQKGLIRALDTSNMKARPCYLRNVGYGSVARDG